MSKVKSGFKPHNKNALVKCDMCKLWIINESFWAAKGHHYCEECWPKTQYSTYCGVVVSPEQWLGDE